MDEMVLTVQKWVNSTYGGKNGFSKAPETGVTGWSTVYSLTRALQLELNIAVPSDNFGDGTSAAYKKWGEMELNKVPTSQQGVNIVKILQGSMYCKGYNPGGFNGTFGEGTKSAVIRLQTDAGLPIRDGKVYDYIFKAFLTMDAFVLTLGGDEKTRQIQQDLNNKYYKTSGVQPCDGHYQRGTNKALVYGLQTEMKIPASEQTGSVGPATREGLPTLKEGSSGRFVTLFQYALYFNGYDSSPFSGSFNSLVKSKVIEFQKFTLLGSDGIAGKQTWLSALVSTGDPNRKGKACDCITEITPDRALALKNAGYET
ncbi:peptidoglycan-binding protein, partial [Priestia aryabhattai]|uniref:peptidoglycan-binding domain-containing protein n=1 Tax=Priestia aryabhattai TaxID=412384 RepID=UPI000B6AA6ED